MGKPTIVMRHIRRAEDCMVMGGGAKIGDRQIRFCDVESINVKRRFLIGRRVAIIVTQHIDYRIHAIHPTVSNFIESLVEAWADYQESTWIQKSL